MMEAMTDGYDQIYLDLIPRLAACELAQNAAHLGLTVTAGGQVTVELFGRPYLVSPSGVEPADGQPAEVNERSLVAIYAMSPGRGEPGSSFVPVFRLYGGVDGGSFDKMRLHARLLREFGGDYAKFAAAARRLGGVLRPGSPDSGHCWDFRPLPRIPARVVFHEADDEFPADIQVMFDPGALRFLEFECLVVLAGCFANALIRAATGASPGGM
jgi:hypothetical protein